MNEDESARIEDQSEVTNGASWSVSYYVIPVLDLYGVSFLQLCISIIYSIYLRLTFTNVIIFMIKYVPTGFYMHRFIKNIYVTFRERLRLKQTELEDIQLQIQIVNTKLCVRDSEFAERAVRLRHEAARLRRVRSRVRDLIATDETLRRAVEAAADCDTELDLHLHPTEQEEDNEFIMELLKNMKREQYAISEPNNDKMDCGEPGECDHTTEQSLYSSLSDMDVRQDCRVKIIKVTNVYKVAYLKNYIKQKRLRRACKRAALKKKMDSIKRLLEDWQKTLNMVINNKLTILNIDAHPMDVTSQEAMGDYSKPQEFSDLDSDLRNEMFYEDTFSLPQRYVGDIYGIEEVQDTAVSRDYYNHDNGDVRYTGVSQCKCGKMSSIIEETGSQVAIEEVTSESGDECRDLVAT